MTKCTKSKRNRKSQCKRKSHYTNYRRRCHDNFRCNRLDRGFNTFNNNIPFRPINDFGPDDPFGQNTTPCLRQCERRYDACLARYGSFVGPVICSIQERFCEIDCNRG